MLSHAQQFETPWTGAPQDPLYSTISQTLLKFMSIESVMLSNHLTLCCPPLLPSVFSSIRVFSSELALHIRCPKYWSFSFSISPSSVYSGFISLRIDWFDLFALQGLSRVFSSISSLALSLLYSPTLTSLCDYCRNHSFDCTDLCRQSDIFAF